MAPIRPCETGDQAGFTLTELLVVLAIIGLLVAAIPVLLQSAVPGTRSLAAARALAGDLRAARGQAVAAGTALSIHFDAARQVYRVMPNGAAHRLPAGVPFALDPARGADIAFFADGSSSGGGVSVGDGALKHRVAVEWLSGRVSIDE